MKFRCGYDDSSGCGVVFEVDDDHWPSECPECGCVYCGDDCCGFVAIPVDDFV